MLINIKGIMNLDSPKAKPLSAAIAVLLHGQTLQRGVNKIFNKAVFSKEEQDTFNIDEIKQQVLSDAQEILTQLDILKTELSNI